MATKMVATGPESAVHITKLPMEILSQLPHFLGNIDDLYALLSTSRILYLACAGTPAKLAPSKKMDKRLTLAGTARQIGDWASLTQHHKDALITAFNRGGNDLLQLATKVALLDLNAVRALHGAKENIIRPLTEKLQGGCSLCGQGRFYKKHCLDIETVLYDFVTYCELFHYDIASKIDADSAPKAMGRDMRMYWIQGCLRDVDYKGHKREVLRNRRLRDLCNLYSCHTIFHEMLWRLPCEIMGDLVTWPPEIGRPFANHMMHQGLTTLKLVLQGGFNDLEERPQAIEDFENKIGLENIDDPDLAWNLPHPDVNWSSLQDDLLPLARAYL